MENKTIYIRTSKGEDEVRGKTPHLSGDIKRALLMVDGTSTFGEISKRTAPSLRSMLGDLFHELERGGFIQDKTRMESISRMAAPPKVSIPPKIVMPVKMATPVKKPPEESSGELDFTAAFRAPSPEVLAAEGARIAAEKAEAHAREEAEAAKLKAQQEAETARLKAEQEAARVRAEQEVARAKAEAEARAREEAERRAQAEAANLKAQQEAEAARRKAEAEAKARAEAEAKAKQEIEAARLKAQQEAEAARRKAEEEAAKARQEIEAAKLKAQQEAEAARHKAEQEAAKAREDAERAKQQAAAEAKVREEAERRAREEAEAARAKAEQEAAQVRAELEAAKARAEAEAKAREEAERRAQAEAETARQQAQQEAEAARRKAEEEAAKAKQEFEAAKLKAQLDAEAARRKAEEEAAKAREEAERAKQVAAAEARAREEAERRAREEAESARAKAEQEAARARSELETARAEAEAKAREEALRQAQSEEERLAKERAVGIEAQQLAEAALLQSAREAATAEAAKQRTPGASRSTSVTVLFLDVVGYTKQPVNKQIQVKKQFNQLLSDCLEAVGEGERIILDTGDGAAVGFLQHPEDALEAAMQFRKTVTANQHQDYPDINVRIGIHLGPINVIKDIKGESNMVGDGINDAQRVMSFAGSDQIYVSRPYYDFISRLSDEYADLFEYRGSQKDKHGREHQVYELVEGGAAPAVEIIPSGESGAEIKLEPFSIAMPAPVTITPPEPSYEEPQQHREDAALISDVDKFNHTEVKPAVPEKPVAAEPVEALPKASPAAKGEAAPAKPSAEARMPSEEEVMKLAETQAKAWAAAEQRALETAKAKAEKRPSEPPVEAPKKVVERTRRKPMPWGKIGGGVFVAALAALFVVPFVLPMKDYATRIEQELSSRLQQPVHVGKLAGRILPTPRLEMSEVYFGERKQIQAQQARVNFAFSALFSSTKPIDSVELEGVLVNGAELQKVSTWLQQSIADPQHPVSSIKLNQGKLEAEGFTISGVGGELKFDRSGKLAQGKLHAEDNKYALDINAAGDKLQVAINVRGAALPLLPNWVFDDLNAKGELTGDGLKITEMDSRIRGGILLGEASIDWRSGWKAQGNLVAKTVTLQNLNKLLEGDVDGQARFRMQSASLSKLTEAATLDGDFVVKKGIINGMDIVETARLRSRTNLPGGRTHFDELTGELNFADGVYHFRKLKMQAGVLAATGGVDITGQKVSGNISADLSMRTAMGTVPLQIGGTTESLTLRVR